MPRRVIVLPPRPNKLWAAGCITSAFLVAPLLAWLFFPWWMLRLSWWQQWVFLLVPPLTIVSTTRAGRQQYAAVIGTFAFSIVAAWIGTVLFACLYSGAVRTSRDPGRGGGHVDSCGTGRRRLRYRHRSRTCPCVPGCHRPDRTLPGVPIPFTRRRGLAVSGVRPAVQLRGSPGHARRIGH